MAIKVMVPIRDTKEFSGLDDALHGFMKMYGLTQEQAAEIMGLSRASIANMVAGSQAISIEHLETLANHFMMTIKIEFTYKAEP